jgi:hypothetical protein
MDFKIPKTMEMEHEEPRKELQKATAEIGATGSAAKQVASILHPHFVKEEDFALPPLGSLSSLAKGKVTPDMKDILLMTDKLKSDLHQMLEEHKKIAETLERLVAAARKTRNQNTIALQTSWLSTHKPKRKSTTQPQSLWANT